MKCVECGKSETTYICKDCGSEYCADCANVVYDFRCECISPNIVLKSEVDKTIKTNKMEYEKMECGHERRWEFNGGCLKCDFVKAQDEIDEMREQSVACKVKVKRRKKK